MKMTEKEWKELCIRFYHFVCIRLTIIRRKSFYNWLSTLFLTGNFVLAHSATL